MERAQRLSASLRDAVVTLTSYHPQEPVCNASGFLIERKGRLYVVTAAHEVLASTVTDPNRPLYAGVYNVNGVRGANYAFPLRILGVDASADVAVLCIEQCGDCCPCAGKHSSIRFQDSRKSCAGDAVFTVGSALNADLHSFTLASVRDPQWCDLTGRILVPCMLTDLLVYSASSGSPILDARTGGCLGLLTFSSQTSSGAPAVGFSGGCDSRTLRRIVDDILACRRVQEVAANDGQVYLTHLKGWLGNVGLEGVTPHTLATRFPDSLCALALRGFVLTLTDPASPLSNLLDAPPLQVGDILVWGQICGQDERYTFGGAQGQVALGALLWQIDPLSSCNLVRFGVIRSPSTCVETVVARLDLVQPPSQEQPPSIGANQVCVDTVGMASFGYSFGQVGICGEARLSGLTPGVTDLVLTYGVATTPYEARPEGHTMPLPAGVTPFEHDAGLFTDFVANVTVRSASELSFIAYIYSKPEESSGDYTLLAQLELGKNGLYDEATFSGNERLDRLVMAGTVFFVLSASTPQPTSEELHICAADLTVRWTPA